MTDEYQEETEECQHDLWVEKYAPKHFTELLSDDVSTSTSLFSKLHVQWLQQATIMLL